MADSRQTPLACPNCAVVEEKVRALQTRLNELEPNGPSDRAPFALDDAQRAAVHALLEGLSPARKKELQSFRDRRKRGANLALVANLDHLIDLKAWRDKEATAQLQISQQQLSNWRKDGQMDPENRVRVKAFLTRNGFVERLSPETVRQWEERFLVCWLSSSVLSPEGGGKPLRSKPHLDDVELAFLKFAIYLGWHPALSALEPLYGRIPTALKTWFPSCDSRWFRDLLHDYGAATLLMIWKFVHEPSP